MKKKPIILCIMDGFAISNQTHGNAIYHAKKPHLDALFSRYPQMVLQASGLAVGLPDNQIGNSEVGHMNIGAGRVVYQSLTYIHEKMRQGDFAVNPAFLNACHQAKIKQRPLHLLGLLSEGGVHSHQDHMFALLALAKQQGVLQTYVHVFLDGRDVDPQAGRDSMQRLCARIQELDYGCIASISGRYYAMDRDRNFGRLNQAYQVMVERQGLNFDDAIEYLENEYQRQAKVQQVASDEFVLPAYNRQVMGQIQNHDSLIFANFRPDRAIQMATVLTNPTFYQSFGYVPETKLHDITLVTMMPYSVSVKGEHAYELDELKRPLGSYLAEEGFKQLRISETEKYAHVTFFFDGMVHYDGVAHPPLLGCERILIPSPKVATYDLKPEMSAYEITEALLTQLQRQYFDIVILNYANCDMVGHTSDFSATIRAVETVDACVGQLYDYVQEQGGLLILTADHGNADCLLDDLNQPVTAHTTNPVPFVVCDDQYECPFSVGKLADIAPTLLALMNVAIPSEMTGQVLVRKKQTPIETTNLLLRSFEMSDLNDFYAYCRVPGVGEAAGWPHHQTSEESKKILEQFVVKQDEYAIVLKKTNRVIGSIGLHQVHHPEGEKEIGYVVSKDYWGQGYATEAVASLLKHYFHHTQVHTIWVAHQVGNKASQRVIEKNHFVWNHESIREMRLLQEERVSWNYRITNKEYRKRGKSK